MSYTDEDQTVALAGIFQAAALTRALGRDGKAPEAALMASVHSLLQIDSPDVGSVFKEMGGVALGLTTLKSQVFDGSARDIELTRYVIALFQLEAKLARDRRRLEQIGTAIASLKLLEPDTADAQTQLFAGLADVYSQNISTLSPRIMVKGEALYLQNEAIAARIRSCLLAGIRAVHLWRQLGGKRWHLFFRRKRILRCANRLLDHIRETATVL